uniref:Trafficking protein particle complex subunit 12 n=2 Tax=Petromyzon marinus TaxID=7757 RepID=A0AAJ7TEW0_PETMA|nr:trafficking protein particle complex subunit 12 [Petromyzon marinus]XP_032815582.1 trafficking protein particle complex subunit 12 [Petromyzon marinus]
MDDLEHKKEDAMMASNQDTGKEESEQDGESLPPATDTIDLGPEENDDEDVAEMSALLGDTMMESVLISDSPSNSEDDGTAESATLQTSDKLENGAETELRVGFQPDPKRDTVVELACVASEMHAATGTSPPRTPIDSIEGTNNDVEIGEADIAQSSQSAATVAALDQLSPEEEDSLPVCTIFSKAPATKVHAREQQAVKEDGFQSQMVKSASFTACVEPSNPKAAGADVIHPSPSLSKFFAEEPSTTGAEFFDSFTSASVITSNNPNVDSQAPPSGLTSLSLSPSESQKPFAESEVSSHTSTEAPPSQAAGGLESPQPFSVFAAGEDAFVSALSVSESDRRHDAWLPSEETRRTLIAVATQQYGNMFVERERLTMPGLKADAPQEDPVKDLLHKCVGEQEAAKRKVLTVDSVEPSLAGLKQLINSWNWRAAVELTGRLLTAHGQGHGKCGQPSSHTTDSIQLWFVRLALLVKLRLFGGCDAELEPFGNLDHPDLYYEYYPHVYPARRGSMVPFSLRILHAELPQYLGRPQETLDRLHQVGVICAKILSNLENGLAEDGSMINLSTENRQASVQLWRSRVARVHYSTANCLLLMKDYCLAVNTYEAIIPIQPEQELQLLNNIGKILLQVGDLAAAQKYFQRVESICENKEGVQHKTMVLMNRAFALLAENNFPDAYRCFQEVSKLDPTNAVANNNAAVCLLYMGKLKESLRQLEELIQKEPQRYLHESVLFNLSTMYELESSRSTAKKQGLLATVAPHSGDSFGVQCLKML